MHYSNLSSKQVTDTTTIAKSTWRNPQLSRIAFQKCSVTIKDNLDVPEIHPQLNSKGLLTKKDNEKLQNDYITNTKKILHLLDVLPKKGDRFLDDFLYCLGTTTKGTGHADIAKALSESYNDEVRKARSGYTANKVRVCACVCVHIYVMLHGFTVLSKQSRPSFW